MGLNCERVYADFCLLSETNLKIAKTYFRLNSAAFKEFKPGILSISIPSPISQGGEFYNLLTVDQDQAITGMLAIEDISTLLGDYFYTAGVYDLSVYIDEPYRGRGFGVRLVTAAAEFMRGKLAETEREGVALLRANVVIPLDDSEKERVLGVLESIGYKKIGKDVFGKEVTAQEV